MKKNFFTVLMTILLAIPFLNIHAQELEILRGDSVAYGQPGDELILYTHAVNVSSVDQVIFIVRTENVIPGDWTSSLCFDQLCFPPNFDSVATDAGFSLEPVHPGDTVEVSVHFFTSSIAATGHVQIQVGTAHNPNNRTTINQFGSTEPNAVNDDNHAVKEFTVFQNYPNPFNPATTISYAVPQRTNVNIKVYNITGKEITTLVNEVKEAGAHTVNFNAENLSSGIYFYRVTAGQFTTVRKMILIK